MAFALFFCKEKNETFQLTSLDDIMKYSIVVPVYNRPDEVDELLQSLVGQTEKDFEVVIVEDGSAIPHLQ